MANNPVLFIDDNLTSRLLNCAILRDSGFEILEAQSAMEALAIMQRHPRLLALVTDVGLGGGGDGFEIVRRARVNDPDLPVIYTCGKDFDQCAHEGLRGSVLISRPFDPYQIVQALDQAARLAPAGADSPPPAVP
jgi:CheY-like chemotaxis protein